MNRVGLTCKDTLTFLQVSNEYRASKVVSVEILHLIIRKVINLVTVYQVYNYYNKKILIQMRN